MGTHLDKTWPLSAAATILLRKAPSSSSKPEWNAEYAKVRKLTLTELIAFGVYVPVDGGPGGAGGTRFQRAGRLPASAPFPLQKADAALAGLPVGTLKELSTRLGNKYQNDDQWNDSDAKNAVEHRLCDDGLLERGKKSLVTREMRYRRTPLGDEMVAWSRELETSLQVDLPRAPDREAAERLVAAAGSLVVVGDGGIQAVAETDRRFPKKQVKKVVTGVDEVLDLAEIDPLALAGGLVAASVVSAASAVSSGGGSFFDLLDGVLDGW